MGLSPHFNLFLGPNAAGKTSLLEAVYFLSTGRSFRTSRVGDLLRDGASEVVVRGEIGEQQGGGVRIGIARSREGIEARVGGSRVRAIADLAELLPVVAVYPEGQDLVTGGPGLRRSLVDWGLFHGRGGFRSIRARYLRALRQRNALLRAGGGAAALAAWEEELVQAGEVIDEQRRRYVEVLQGVVRELGEGQGIGLRYRGGWGEAISYRETLERGRERDRAQGFTQAGPHRADVVVELNGAPAGRVASRGQQKLIAALLRVGQVSVLARATGKRSVVLVDDVASELDQRAREGLMEVLRDLQAQLLVTAIEREGVPELEWRDEHVFHVEHGEIRELI